MAFEDKLSRSVTSVRRMGSLFGRGGATMTRARRYLWLAPLLAMGALIFAGTWVRARMEHTIKTQTEEALKALLSADVAALELWLSAQKANAVSFAEDKDVRAQAIPLAALAAEGEVTAAKLLQAPEAAKLRAELLDRIQTLGYAGYSLLTPEATVLAARTETIVGQNVAEYSEFVTTAAKGKPVVSRPFPSIVRLPDESGQLRTGVPTMFAAAPVRNDAGDVVAVLGLRLRPEQEFTRILNVARFGQSGETYAFDKNGLFLSNSRFDEQLKRIGLQVDQPSSRSVLTVEVRDPGVNMLAGERPSMSRAEQPLTRPVGSAVTGQSGVDVEGYRDYRGVMNFGAWTWLPEYGFGVVTEIDKAEAMRPLITLRYAFWTLFGVLVALALGLLALTLLAGRLGRRMREAVIAAGKLGQYALEEKIGQGGMGSVYRGHHAMLRRPTAIKLLEPSKTTEVSIARFEREVQMTSQLNHPNTITIYDYGRTPEGVFYYAMEFLDGFSLQTLVDRFGPQPDGRVVHILTQVCGSLIEAHSQGLIHRDIKPANIMLTRRGGVRDYIKLLDFGLVKAVDAQKTRVLTAADSLTGTPLYMSPESIEDPDRADARSDLYALGAVGYFLLTGRPVFDATNVMEIVRHHLETAPVPPTKVLGRPICTELEWAVLACLAKQPGQRPASAAELAATLEKCQPVSAWTAKDSEQWWQQYQGVPADTQTQDRTLPSDQSPTMGYSEVNPTKR